MDYDGPFLPAQGCSNSPCHVISLYSWTLGRKHWSVTLTTDYRITYTLYNFFSISTQCPVKNESQCRSIPVYDIEFSVAFTNPCCELRKCRFQKIVLRSQCQNGSGFPIRLFDVIVFYNSHFLSQFSLSNQLSRLSFKPRKKIIKNFDQIVLSPWNQHTD